MKLLKSLDDNILKILLTFFIFFIPLFMKFPFQNVNFTYISIRIDDFMSVLITTIFAIQVLRGKVSFKKLPFKLPFAIFWAAVLLAFVSGFYFMETIDYATVGFLHAARRIQYMVLFFIAVASIKSYKDFMFLLFALVGSIFLADIYGLGQRLFSFPAISTMNPEFAKGRILYLTPEARLSSTFAGHYDLGAYLVFLFPLLWALFAYAKRYSLTLYEKIFLFVAAMFPLTLNVFTLTTIAFNTNVLDSFMIILSSKLFTGMIITTGLGALLYVGSPTRLYKWFIMFIIILSIIVLLSTSSRSSSIAYAVSLTGFLLYYRRFRYLILAIALSIALTSFDTDLVKRWAQTIQIKEIIINAKTGEQVVVQKIRSDELPAGTAFMKKKRVSGSTDSAFMKQELIDKATLSGKLNTATQDGITDAQDYQTYSAVAGDISIATRFQVSWPRAYRAFLRNPVLGTGPSSITESTDGDYLRWIGELGALGAGSFVFVIGSILLYLYNHRKLVELPGQMLIVAVIFGTGGLLINATLIDVFEASKVAYIFWLTLGLFVGLLRLDKKELAKV